MQEMQNGQACSAVNGNRNSKRFYSLFCTQAGSALYMHVQLIAENRSRLSSKH